MPTDSTNSAAPDQDGSPPWFINFTMCPGCGQMRRLKSTGRGTLLEVLASEQTFVEHHTAWNGTDGPICTQRREPA